MFWQIALVSEKGWELNPQTPEATRFLYPHFIRNNVCGLWGGARFISSDFLLNFEIVQLNGRCGF